MKPAPPVTTACRDSLPIAHNVHTRGCKDRLTRVRSLTLPPEDTAAPDESATPRAAAAPPDGLQGRSVLRGGFWATAGTVSSQVYTIIGSILTARFLGVAAVGRVSFIALVEGTLIVLLTQGLPRAMMRFTGESLGRGDEGDVRDLIHWSSRIGAAGAVASGTVLVVAGFVGATPRWAWVFAGIACAAGVMQAYPSAFLTGTQRWRTLTLAGLVPVTAGMFAKVIALTLGAGLTSLFLIDACASVITLAVTVVVARRALRPLARSPRPNHQLHMDTLRFGAIATLGVLVTFVVWRRTEVFFLEHYTTDVQVALYSIPFSAISALLVIPQGASSVLAPAFATLLGAGAHERIAAGVSRALRTSVLLSLFLTAATIALGPTLLRLVYGSSFRGTGRLLVILALPFPLVALMYTCLAVLLGLRRQWFAIASDAVAAVLNLTLDGILIPRYHALGAASANGVAQTLGSIPLIVYTVRVVDGVEWKLSTLGRGAVAAVAAGAAAWAIVDVLGGVAGVTLGLVAALGVWVGLLALLRGVVKEDADWLRETVHLPRRAAAEGSA